MSVLDVIFNLFAWTDSPEKKQLREVRKYLRNNRAGFIKVGKNTLQPSMAKFFHNLYYFSVSYGRIVARMRKSEMIFSIIFEECLTDKQKARFLALSPQALEERSKAMPIDQLRQEAYDIYSSLVSELKVQDMKRINETYSLFKVFEELVTFDYYPLLRSFDPNLPEGDFKYRPKFNAIKGESGLSFLKNFSEVLNLVAFAPHWEQVFSAVRVYNKGVDPLKPSIWQKVIKDLAGLRKSGLIEAIIHRLDDNMSFSPRSVLRVENLSSRYLEGYKDSIESFLWKLQEQQEKKEIERLMTRVFSSEDLERIHSYKMKNYSEEISSRIYSKIGFGYKYFTALWYLKAFVIERLKTDFKDIVNLMVVKGQWRTSQFSRDLSDALHDCMTLSEDIVNFDDMLSEVSPYGKRIFVLIHRVGKDRSATDMLKQMLEDINGKAYGLLKKASNYFNKLDLIMKEIRDDYAKDTSSRELLLNWKELEGELDSTTGRGAGESFKDINEKLGYFIEFLRLYLS